MLQQFGGKQIILRRHRNGMARHTSILANGETLAGQICEGKTYKCPLCPYKAAKCTIEWHIRGHSFVKHGEFKILKCGLQCRDATHFHCCYCTATLINRAQLLKHLDNHQKHPKHPVVPQKHPLASVRRQAAKLQQPAALQQPPLASVRRQAAKPQQPAALQQHTLASSVYLVVQPAALQQHPAAILQPVSHSQPPAAPSHKPVADLQHSVACPQLPVVHPRHLPDDSQQLVGLTPQSLAVLQSPSVPPSTIHVPKSQGPPTKSPRLTIQRKKDKKIGTCPHCKLKLNRKNMKTHVRRKHSKFNELVSSVRFLASQCVDPKNCIFVVEKSFCGPTTPVHVVKNIWGPTQKVMCELDQCQLNADFALRCEVLTFECQHLRSLLYCPRADTAAIQLTEEALVTMVRNKWFGEECKASLLQRQQKADAEGVPLSVQLTVGGPSTTLYVSVYEPEVSCYSKLGRVIISYDTQLNTWHCPCSKTRHSCVHKAIGKWHLFDTNRQLFKSMEIEEAHPSQHTIECDEYPPSDEVVTKMVNYLISSKKLPAELPQALIQQSRDAKALDDFPKHLIPKETECKECERLLTDPVLITANARILTTTGVAEGISTYRKSCLNCGMIYRYQEWEEGVHNFDDHIILSLHMCLTIRNALQAHTAVSRVIETIEATEGVSFPEKERVLQAYVHFEALTDHDYMYSCVTCGSSPAVVVMDLHKNGVFSMPATEIKSPPEDLDGHVDIDKFWDAVAAEMISRGLIPYGRRNPFVVPPSYHHWSPWIGPCTRQSDVVLNTEFAKIQCPKLSDEWDDDDRRTVERLSDELLNLKVQEVRALCEQCGVDSKGSKMDLVLRLQEKMSNRVTYNKVFKKVWGSSGGWAVITCPCGIVYSLKFILRAESPRDYVDLLLSWKHFPNVVVYDSARALALHTNHRQPETFGRLQGSLLDPSPENIKQASEGNVQVNIPWLRHPKIPADKDGHPLTGSSERFALSGVFHQGNSKDERDALRQVGLVPELAALINSQCVEQLFSGMRENNYFLNVTTPSTHIFLQRNILHHGNVTKNKKAKEQYEKK